MNNFVVLIGYGGHALVAADILNLQYNILGYCDNEKKEKNTSGLTYLGTEDDFFLSDACKKNHLSFFISIGNNVIREKIFHKVKQYSIANAIHSKSIIAASAKLGSGILVAGNAIINPFCKIGDGVICNTSSSIDHECTIDNFSHIAPGAVLCGNITIGKKCFVGANSVIKQGITICDNVIIGASSAVVKDICEEGIYYGNPAKRIFKRK